MITFIIIVSVIFIIVSMKKKTHNSIGDMEARDNFPPFSITAPEMSTFSKIMNLAIDKSSLLHYISYYNGLVEIRMKNGKGLVSKLSTLHVDFSKNQGLIVYYVKSPAGKVEFYQTTNITNKQWDVINSLLCLAGSTRGEEIFGSTYKKIGYVNMALKAIKHFQ